MGFFQKLSKAFPFTSMCNFIPDQYNHLIYFISSTDMYVRLCTCVAFCFTLEFFLSLINYDKS